MPVSKARPLYAPGSRTGPFAKYIASTRTCPGASNILGSTVSKERAMRCLINIGRSRRHVRRVSPDRVLHATAVAKNTQLFRCQRWAHTPCHRSFLSTFKAANYSRGSRSWTVGENIAYASLNEASPQSVLKEWLKSDDGHRENLFTSSWREQSVSLRIGKFQGDEVAMWVSHFGKR